MFSRQVSRAAARAAPRTPVRAFGSTATQCRAPSLADVTPDRVDQFNTKQRQFREQLIEAQKKREERKLELHLRTCLPTLLLYVYILT